VSADERPPSRASRGLQVRSIDLRSFVVLSRTRHFGRAAAELATTQPAISARIAALEEELGCRLIERGDGVFRLTEAGERALETFEEVLMRLDGLVARLRQEPEPVAATLRIGAIDTVAATWLPGLIETLHGRYPQLRVELTVDGTKALSHGLKKGFFDIIFAIHPVVDEGFRSFSACVLQMIWVGSPRLINPERIYTPQDLAGMPIITFPRDTPPYQMVAPYFQDEQVLASKLTSCNSLYAIVSLLLDSFGVAALPTVAIRRELASGRLVSMKVTKHFPSMPVIASYQALTHQQFMRAVAEESRRAAALFCATVKPGTAWVE
jgi:DNA-binding transcriptional LysR family regulator